MASSDRAYSVYWIAYPQHTDPYSEGYVGVTHDIEYRIKRYQQHGQRSRLRAHFINGAAAKVLAKGLHYHEAMQLERKLRPTRNIGWNKNSGGFMPPIPQKGV